MFAQRQYTKKWEKDVNNENPRTDKSLYDCLNKPLGGGEGGSEMRNMGPGVFVQMQA
jgi:hypothetical protein